ncbi:hypothetical protein [Pseudoalteromonas pernae]|uniref:hypothetical protein n=1 Tax=Pseudoalteromonas pernae TaxID=3118054 RepID=UPI0032427563
MSIKRFNSNSKLLISLLTLVSFTLNAGVISQSYKGLKAAFKKSTVTITPPQSIELSKELKKYQLSRKERFRVEKMVSQGRPLKLAMGMTETGKRANAQRAALKNIEPLYSGLNWDEKLIQVNKTLQLAYEYERVLGLVEPRGVYHVSIYFRGYGLTLEKLLKGLILEHRERLESYITQINETTLQLIPSYHWEKFKSEVLVTDSKVCNKLEAKVIERIVKHEMNTTQIEGFIANINTPEGRYSVGLEKLWYLPLHSETLTHQLNTEYQALEKVAKETLFGKQLVKLYETVEQPFGPVKITWSSIKQDEPPEIKVEVPMHCGISYSFKVSTEVEGKVKETTPFVLDSFNMPILTPQLNRMITSMK